MGTPPTGRRAAADFAQYAALAAATLVAGFALRYPSLFEPRWYGDEGIFAAIAQNMREGRALYAQAWDNKPPLIYFTYAGIQSAFGTGMFALRLVTAIVALATQAGVIVAAAVLYGRWRAIIAGLVFAAVMDTPIIEGNLALTETYMILPATLGVIAFLLAERQSEDRRSSLYLAAGLLTGVAAGYKQVAVLDFAAMAAMVWLLHGWRWRALAPLAAGFAAPQIVLAGYFLAAGAFGPYWYAVVGFLGRYESFSSRSGSATVRGALPALVVLAWLVWRRRRGEPVTLAMFPALWFASDVAGATGSGFAYPHYLLQAAPSFAVLLSAMPQGFERALAGRAALAAAGVLAVLAVDGQFGTALRQRRQLDTADYYRTFVSYRTGSIDQRQYDDWFDGKVIAVNDIARSIAQDGAGRSLFTWSDLPWLYAAGGLTNPTRYYTSWLGVVVPGAKAEIMRDLERDPPVYVVVSGNAYAPFEQLDAFLQGRYSLIRAQNDWRLYRLASAHGRLQPATAATAGR